MKDYRVHITGQDGTKSIYDICLEENTPPTSKSFSRFNFIYRCFLVVGAAIFAFYAFASVVLSQIPNIDRTAITLVGCIISTTSIVLLLFLSFMQILVKKDFAKNLTMILVSVLFSIIYMVLSYVCLSPSFSLIESAGDCATVLGLILLIIDFIFDQDPLGLHK